MSSSRLRPSSQPVPEWYDIYLKAVVQADESKALLQIERASKAIEERLVHLRSGSPGLPQEFQDLNCALVYLRLLLDNIVAEGRTPHEFNRRWISPASSS
jgi:hypothetical protein